MKLLVLLTLLPITVLADMISPSHNCARPARPSQVTTDAERMAYNRQVGTYKQCLSDFINEQKSMARLRPDHTLVYKRNWADPEDRIRGVAWLTTALAQISTTENF